MNIFQDIIEDACGKGEDGLAKSAISLCSETININTDECKTGRTNASQKPIVQIGRMGDYIRVDLQFKTHHDNDLRVLWAQMEKYGADMAEINEDSENIPFITLTIVPSSYSGQYYMSAINPLFWALQPMSPGGECLVIRMVFREEDFGFYESDEVNVAELEAEANRRDAEREMIEAKAELQEIEREEYSKKRNERIEELRAKGEM